MDSTEIQIIKSCQAGHMESFVILYDRYVEKIYKFLYYRTNAHRELSEDLTSQTFIRAMEKIATFKADRGTFQAWLYQVARNILIDHYRKNKSTENIDEHLNIASNENLEKQAAQKLTNEDLQKILQTLPQEAQELINMRLWDELSYAEIAAITGKTEGSLK
ncbi:MAG: sigma-70 family RNA polymerase sigma factor, partial [bacterium]|nr:sigma-70 family RNA polymerase sigma factor [bacterium]